MTEIAPTYLLKELLDVDQKEDDVFVGHRVASSRGRVFGGQVLAQALMAAIKTVDAGKQLHSCHNYFIRPGDCDFPIEFEVFRDLDGRTFSNRRVIARQNNKPIFNLTASFQSLEKGYHHQIEMPEVPAPDGLLNENQLADKYKGELPELIYNMVNTYRPVEVRPVDDLAHFVRGKPSTTQAAWMKAREVLPENQALHRSVLAYATDLTLLSTCARAHNVTWWDDHMSTASIDHSLWFHSNDIRMDEWVLYVMDSPWSGGGRGLNRGSIFTQDGRLIASVAQEGLIRIKDA